MSATQAREFIVDKTPGFSYQDMQPVPFPNRVKQLFVPHHNGSFQIHPGNGSPGGMGSKRRPDYEPVRCPQHAMHWALQGTWQYPGMIPHCPMGCAVRLPTP